MFRIGDSRGFTLVELMIVVVIIGIMIIAMGMEFVGWKAKYKVEGDLKKMYTDFSSARVLALQTRSVHFVNIPSAEPSIYRIYNDNDPLPDGDGQLDTTNDAVFVNGVIGYTIVPTIRHFGFTKSGIAFGSGGVIQEPEYIRISIGNPDADGKVFPDLNCLEIVSTRINMGLWNATSSQCDTR